MNMFAERESWPGQRRSLKSRDSFSIKRERENDGIEYSKRKRGSKSDEVEKIRRHFVKCKLCNVSTFGIPPG